VPDKTITAQRLLEMVQGGASVKLDQRPMVIEQFGALIEQLKNMIAATEKRASADLARSQTQLEIMSTLQTLIKQQGGGNHSPPVDLAPLHTVLTELQETTAARAEPHDYEFTFDRSPQGWATKIHAKVVRPTLN